MNQPSYRKEPKNARAVCQAMAWLKAVGVSCRPSTIPGTDLILAKKEGGEISLKLAMTSDEPKPADCLVVMAKELASPQTPVALKAFHTITQAVGFGEPIPVDRGPEPEKKLHYSDNFELVSMRHKELRRVPNPDPAELMQYKKVMEQACYRFINMNQELCRRNCLLVEDLMTYAMIWTTNYLGLYKVAVETANDNIRKLRAHLKQRFAEFANMVVKKERNCFPTPDTVQIALLGKPCDENHRLESFSTDPTNEEEEDPGYTERHSELDLSDDESRRMSAAEVLAKHLGSLPHDQMIQILKDATTNASFCADARSEAVRQLRQHQKTCTACGGKPEPLPKQPAPASTTPSPTTEGAQLPEVKPGQIGMTEEAIAAARDLFRGTCPSTTVCFTCHQEFSTQVRLMNKPRLLKGLDRDPKFLTQANCSPCRRSRSGAKVEEQIPGVDPTSTPELS